MGKADYWKDGDYNARCDQCYEKYKASELRRQWDGIMVCYRCLDPRHPQDLIRPPRPEQPPAWTRPSPPPIFISGATNPSGYLINQSLINSTLIGGAPFFQDVIYRIRSDSVPRVLDNGAYRVLTGSAVSESLLAQNGTPVLQQNGGRLFING